MVSVSIGTNLRKILRGLIHFEHQRRDETRRCRVRSEEGGGASTSPAYWGVVNSLSVTQMCSASTAYQTENPTHPPPTGRRLRKLLSVTARLSALKPEGEEQWTNKETRRAARFRRVEYRITCWLSVHAVTPPGCVRLKCQQKLRIYDNLFASKLGVSL